MCSGSRNTLAHLHELSHSATDIAGFILYNEAASVVVGLEIAGFILDNEGHFLIYICAAHLCASAHYLCASAHSSHAH